MPERSLVELIEETIAENRVELPVFDQFAVKLNQLVRKDDFGAADVASLIEKDQSMSSEVLRAANSSFYAGLNPVRTIRDSAVRLGAQTLVSIVTTVAQRRLYRSRFQENNVLLKKLWRHALGSAMGARWLCRQMGLEKLSEECFMAGLFHDFGKLLLLRVLEYLQETDACTRTLDPDLTAHVLETLHASYGAAYLKKLNMPKVYADAASHHHDPEIKGESVLLNVVRLSNLACHKLGIGPIRNPDLMLSTTPEAIALMAKDLLLAELQVKLMDFVGPSRK